MPDAPSSRPTQRRYDRESLEFERVAFFSDAIFAIALTLLVTGLDVPSIIHETSASELWAALGDEQSGIIMFFVSVAVIGSFWVNHHRYVSRLAAVDAAVVWTSLVYLAFIAFLPFPSAVLGQYTDNAVGVSIYAVTIIVIAISGTLLDEVADRHHLRSVPITPEARRWSRVNAAVPVMMFAASIAVAFGISAQLAVYSWLLLIPAAKIVRRRTPPAVLATLQP